MQAVTHETSVKAVTHETSVKNGFVILHDCLVKDIHDPVLIVSERNNENELLNII